MSWIREEELKLSWFERFAIKIIKQGPIPNHVAFIMDGNRRWATRSNLNKCDGHKIGFEKLSQALQWCLEVGIKEVTVYAFSIENFKRPQEEVNTLMQLARDKFAKLLEEKERLNEKGVRIRVIGNIQMLPKDIQKTAAEAMLLTKDNNKSILNVAFAYTSREEITHSLKTIIEGVENNDLLAEDLNEALIDECLYTNKCSNVDLLVRTSGELRFSDYLLWQISSTIFYFTDALWPDFTLWHLLGAVFYYQRCYVQTKILRQHFKDTRLAIDQSDNIRIEKFLAKVEEKRNSQLVEMSKY